MILTNYLDVKQTLKKILTCVKWDKASDLRKAAVDSLIAIYPVNASQFKSQISTFNNAQREDLVKLLLPKLPTLLEAEPEEKSQDSTPVQDTENSTSSGNLITSRKQVENGLEELSPTCDFDVNSPNKLPTTDSNNALEDTRPNEQETQSENIESNHTPADDMKHDAQTNGADSAALLNNPSTTEYLQQSNAADTKYNADEDFEIDLTAAKEALEKPKVDLSDLLLLLESSATVERSNGLAALIDYVIDDEVRKTQQHVSRCHYLI